MDKSYQFTSSYPPETLKPDGLKTDGLKADGSQPTVG